MCGCIVALLAILSPRLAVFALWAFTDRMSIAFNHWYWAAIGFVFLPWTTLAGAGLLAVWDVTLLLDDTPDNTISSVIGDQAWATAAIGYTLGHLVSKSRDPFPRWGSAAGGVVVVLSGVALGDGLVSAVIGFVAGLCFWPNRGV